VAAALLAAMMAGQLQAATADTSDGESASIPAVSYSRGQNGGKLKWVSQRPESAKTDDSVTPVQYTAAVDSLQPALSKKSSADASVDLLGGSKNTPTPAKKKSADDDSLQQLPSEPKLLSTAPKAKSDAPLDLDKAYAAPVVPAPSKASPSLKSNGKKELPLTEDILTKAHEFKESCPSPKDLKPINELTTNIVPPEGDLPHDCPLGNATFTPRCFSQTVYTWTASALCHKPLYFEDVQLERYGHMAGPWLQPFASGANFFLTIPILPYKMGLETPNECMYTLGYYRPGDCAPYLFDPLPISVRGALFEAGAWTGGIFAFP
jgi:hypothetical protein